MPRDMQISDRESEIILSELAKTTDIPGDVVEFGCYEGDTSVLLAREISTDKWLWLYDSFEGLPEKTAADRSALGRDFHAGELRASPDSVLRKFKKYQLPEPVIKKAWFNELDPADDLPEKISFALLDGDFYESIKTSFELILPKLSKGAIIIVHDFRNPALPGAARAVNEFLSSHEGFRLRLSSGLAIIDVLEG